MMWRKTKAGEVQHQWWGCEAMIDCPCGQRDWFITADEDDPKECGCGRKYRIVAYLEVWEEEDEQGT